MYDSDTSIFLSWYGHITVNTRTGKIKRRLFSNNLKSMQLSSLGINIPFSAKNTLDDTDSGF